MKRNKEKIPGFDEIIFRNRNQNYGAYRLRKQYKSTASISVFCGASLMVLIVVLLAMKTDKGIASENPYDGVIITVTPFTPEKVEAVPEKPVDARIEKMIKNLAPVVSTDTGNFDMYMPATDEFIGVITNGDPTDTIVEIKEDPVIPVEPEILVFVQEPPEFPGGPSELLKYVAGHVKYPEEAIANNMQGKVFIKFAVWSDGSVRKVELIKGVDPVLDAEAMRVINTLPLFRPGRQNGVAVPVWFTIPVVFELRN